MVFHIEGLEINGGVIVSERRGREIEKWRGGGVKIKVATIG